MLVALYSASREPRLSIRLVHPDSAQLIDDIESGQSPVPSTYEVVEMAEDAAGAAIQDRLVVSCAEELTEDELAAVEVIKAGSKQNLYLELTDEGLAEIADVVRRNPKSKLVIVTEDGDALPVRMSRNPAIPQSLAIQLGGSTSSSEILKLAEELRKEI